MRRLSTAFAIALLVTSCAPTPTPYQPYRSHSAGGIHGGYSEEKLGRDEVRVRFHGNSMTSRDRVEGYMLYRAAELTLQNGFDWFMVMDRNTEHNIRTIVRNDPLYRPWYGLDYDSWRPNWNVYLHGRGWTSIYGGDLSVSPELDVRQIEAFETTADVKMRKAPIPGDEPRAIDARKVVEHLGPTIERPKP